MKVLISGAAGFIGSNLYKRCADEGWDVSGVDDLSNGHLEFLPEKHNVCIRDFSCDSMLDDIKAQKFEVVVHLAAVPRVSYSVEHPLETNDVNVSRTLKLMDACRGNVKRFVFASSSSVYGGADVSKGPTSESSKKDPKSPYALQKSMIEDYLQLYARLYGLDSICLRFFNVFGKNQLVDSPYSTAVSAWLTAVKKGLPMRSDGTGEQSRDMCHVDNVADACMRAAKVLGTYDGNCYNVACGDRTTNNEIMQYMMKRYPGATKVDAPWRAGDVMHTHADVRRAQADLGYVPIVRFWEGLEKTCDWYDKNWGLVSSLQLNV